MHVCYCYCSWGTQPTDGTSAQLCGAASAAAAAAAVRHLLPESFCGPHPKTDDHHKCVGYLLLLVQAEELRVAGELFVQHLVLVKFRQAGVVLFGRLAVLLLLLLLLGQLGDGRQLGPAAVVVGCQGSRCRSCEGANSKLLPV